MEATKLFEKDNIMSGVNVDIHLFNEIDEMVKENIIKHDNHRGYVYSYLWLNSYLWRHFKYFSETVTIKTVKEVLGRNPLDKKVDYLTKKNGILDSKGYTEYTNDFPIDAVISNEFKFVYISDLDADTAKSIKSIKPRGYNMKKPLHGYSRGDKDGLYFSKDDVVHITLEEFLLCMSNDNIGADSFYLYSWIKMRGKLLKQDEITILYREMTNVLGYGTDKLRMLLSHLEEVELIESESVVSISKQDNSFITRKQYKLIWQWIADINVVKISKVITHLYSHFKYIYN